MRSEFVFGWSGGWRDQRLPLTSILGARGALGRVETRSAGLADLLKCRALVAFGAPLEEFLVVLIRVCVVIQKAFAIVIALPFYVVGDAHVLCARGIVR